MNRRSFLEGAAGAIAGGAFAKEEVPSYLQEYEKLYARNPRAAAVEWFREREIRPVHPLWSIFAVGPA